jgi:hypothetical protein
MRNLRVLALSVLVSILSFSPISKLSAQGAAAQTPPFSGAPFTLSIADLKSASAAIPVSKEFGAEILFEEATYRIAADGTLIYQHRFIYRVDSDSAVKDWSEISSEWDPWYEKPSQLHARVFQAMEPLLSWIRRRLRMLQ